MNIPELKMEEGENRRNKVGIPECTEIDSDWQGCGWRSTFRKIYQDVTATASTRMVVEIIFPGENGTRENEMRERERERERERMSTFFFSFSFYLLV